MSAPGGHDSLPIEEILKRIDAAEAMLSEVRALLGGAAAREIVEGESAATSTAAEDAPAPPVTGVTVVAAAPEGPAADDPMQAVTALFTLALAPPSEPELLSERLGAIMHSAALVTERSVGQIMRFPWARFLRMRDQYLSEPGDPRSFKVVRTRPADIHRADRVKLFLAAPNRSPAPIEVAVDPQDDGAWRVVSFSL